MFSCRQHLYRHRLKCIKLISYDCQSCGKKFDRKDNLTRHHVKCRSKKNHQTRCRICGHYFSKPSNLKKHMSKAHSSTKVDYSCSSCGKSYSRQDHFNNIQFLAHLN